jgi:hypothetical protein
MAESDLVRDNLLTLVSVYRKATGTSLTTASMRFYGNANFFDNLKRGEQSLSVKTLETVLDRISALWPDDVEWPQLRPIFMRRRPK